ncbi:uncharacterized protein B0H18DRAFT_1125451 [Fomitopsis serialis]|uniref:uncharacterized protein n=1 Tax=Fomitopsis serialis TaxID=139415 RepID=UPI002007524D|nr:uncharacterized protein B0H18DRAFT_1125451 [Neoantrodia serialis]KAH9914573.1 hypothetical protein B0H18DRAFT_1125451 [Neoantrodia serialis]
MFEFKAIIIPAGNRPPRLVDLKASPLATPAHHPPGPFRCGLIPHPELYYDRIAYGLGPRSWQFEPVESLEGMSRRFATPYIVFYPTVSSDGLPFPINKCAREIQGDRFEAANAWRGDLIIAKYIGQDYAQMTHASMSDFPIVKNWLSKKLAP